MRGNEYGAMGVPAAALEFLGSDDAAVLAVSVLAFRRSGEINNTP